MYKVVKKEILNRDVILLEVEAPYVSARCEAGQFVIVRLDEDGERIPLTIADYDREKNTVTVVIQMIGYSTKLMGNPLHMTSMPAPQKSEDSTGPRLHFLGSIFLANIWLWGWIPGLERSPGGGHGNPFQ